VFVLSPDAVVSDVTLKEVAHAASLNKRFAPIVCRRAPGQGNLAPRTLARHPGRAGLKRAARLAATVRALVPFGLGQLGRWLGMNGGIFEPETDVASGAPVARGQRQGFLDGDFVNSRREMSAKVRRRFCPKERT
jgi:hypothetical protein